jgi:hypothetical protein
MRYEVESVQDFLIKLDIKPLMHLLEMSTFSLNNDLIRLTEFQSHFSVSKIGWISPKKISLKNIWLGDQIIYMKFFENFDF